MNVDYLLLDEIGEENVTAWSRDEILLTILSYRLLNHLPTFFTSLYDYHELKKIYTLKKSDEIDYKNAGTLYGNYVGWRKIHCLKSINYRINHVIVIKLL